MGAPDSFPVVDCAKVWPYYWLMASQTIKSTYTLDVRTVSQLESLAARWNLSRSATLRRLINEAAGRASPLAVEKLKALDELQQRLVLNDKTASAWIRDVGRERMSSNRPASE